MMSCAFGALTEFHITPSKFNKMSPAEKAIVIASYEKYSELIKEARDNQS